MSNLGMLYLAENNMLPTDLVFYVIVLPVVFAVGILVTSLYGDDK